MDLAALSAYSSLAAAIGQIASAVAVVVSLVYLALQLRHNTQAVQAQTYLSVQTNTISITSAIYSHQEFAELVLTAADASSSLSPAQAFRWNAFMRSNFRQFDNLYHQFQAGALEADVWPGYEQIMIYWLRRPGCFRWFEENSHFFSSSLQNYYSAKIRPQLVRQTSEMPRDSSKVTPAA
jgi:hypothetical protein